MREHVYIRDLGVPFIPFGMFLSAERDRFFLLCAFAALSLTDVFTRLSFAFLKEGLMSRA